MCAVPLFSQNAMFNDWIPERGCWLRKFDTCPLSEVLAKMIWMLERHPRPEDREAGFPLGIKLRKQKGRIKLRSEVSGITW